MKDPLGKTYIKLLETFTLLQFMKRSLEMIRITVFVSITRSLIEKNM